MAYLNADRAVVALVLLKHVLLQHLHGGLRVSTLRVTDGTGIRCDVLHRQLPIFKAQSRAYLSNVVCASDLALLAWRWVQDGNSIQSRTFCRARGHAVHAA